jgi:hypothetical protein
MLWIHLLLWRRFTSCSFVVFCPFVHFPPISLPPLFVAAMGDDVNLWVNYPCKSETRGPGSVRFEVDNSSDQVGLVRLGQEMTCFQ